MHTQFCDSKAAVDSPLIPYSIKTLKSGFDTRGLIRIDLARQNLVDLAPHGNLCGNNFWGAAFELPDAAGSVLRPRGQQ